MALSAGDSGEFLWHKAAAANRDELPFFSSSGSWEAEVGGELRAAMAGPPDRDKTRLFFYSLFRSFLRKWAAKEGTIPLVKTH